jgi:hypothetical protein
MIIHAFQNKQVQIKLIIVYLTGDRENLVLKKFTGLAKGPIKIGPTISV